MADLSNRFNDLPNATVAPARESQAVIRFPIALKFREIRIFGIAFLAKDACSVNKETPVQVVIGRSAGRTNDVTDR